MSALEYLACLPALDLPDPLETNSLLFLGHRDHRYVDLKTRIPHLKEYLESFREPLGQPLSPTIVAAKRPRMDQALETLLHVRDALALASVSWSTAQTALQKTRRGVPCSDFFDFYPYNLAKGTDGFMTLQAPFEQGMAWVDDQFRGQPNPTVVHPTHFSAGRDEYLLTALVRLVDNDGNLDPDQRTRLLRALTAAFHAMRAPPSVAATRDERGFRLSLWVTAFELIARAPTAPDVGFIDVANLLKSVPWAHERLRRPRCSPVATRPGRSAPPGRTTRPIQIYSRLYRTRNDFLHGNDLPQHGIERHRRANWGRLDDQAPILFRSALLHLLDRHGIAAFPTFRSRTVQRRHVHAQLAYEQVLYSSPKELAGNRPGLSSVWL